MLTGEALIGLDVLRPRLLDDPVGQRGWWITGVLVPAGFFGCEPIAHELLVERQLDVAGLSGIGRPISRGIGGQHFIGKDVLAVVLAASTQTDLELGVGQDEPAVAGNRLRALVDR